MNRQANKAARILAQSKANPGLGSAFPVLGAPRPSDSDTLRASTSTKGRTRRAQKRTSALFRRSTTAAGILVLSGWLEGCSWTETRVEATWPPEVRVDIADHGLLKGFFLPDAETKCAGQIIGYRFVVWLDNDSVAVGFNTSPNCRPSPDRKVSGSARLLAFNVSGGVLAGVIFHILPMETVRSRPKVRQGPVPAARSSSEFSRSISMRKAGMNQNRACLCSMPI